MIFPDSLPSFKRFLKPCALNPVAVAMLLRLAVAFLDHRGRMSALAAAGSVQSDPRHRAQLTRWLARWPGRWRALRALARSLIGPEPARGLWVFCVDSTFVGHQGKPANAHSRANTRARARKAARNQLKYHKRSCHCFVMGLLISPTGLRVPYCLCYHTREYCQLSGLSYRTQAQLAAELIGRVELPPGAELVVLGDTAFDSKDVHKACSKRGFGWVVPINPERVLAGPARSRPKVRGLIQNLTEGDYAEVRLTPHRDARRRPSCGRAQSKRVRRYHINSGEYRVHSVGDVRLVFSRTGRHQEGGRSPGVKVLMSDRVKLGGREVVQLYALRWQIELFFKELKGELGFGQYRLRDFKAVESWVEACLITFCYLEWYRRLRLTQSPEPRRRRWWQGQRTSGLRLAVLAEVQSREVARIGSCAATETGRRKLRRLARQARQPEDRCAA